jgi:GR25 family glycosyltransferase involved in LPS biosynthesis
MPNGVGPNGVGPNEVGPNEVGPNEHIRSFHIRSILRTFIFCNTFSKSIYMFNIRNITDFKHNMGLTNITDIKHVVYINLDERIDRKTHIEEQLQIIGFKNWQRFKAIKTTNGAMGCSMSHLKCLEIARANNLPYLLICEDDATFLQPAVFKRQFNAFLAKHPLNTWDVVLLAGNNMLPYEKIDNTCIKVSYCQTTTAYLVNGAYFSTLIDNIKKGLQNLIQEPTNESKFAIDKYWLQLQKIDRWFLIIPLTVTQKEGYSDIEKKNVNYTSLMTEVNKAFGPKPPPTDAITTKGEDKFSMKQLMNNALL